MIKVVSRGQGERRTRQVGKLHFFCYYLIQLFEIVI